ncbi:hypothetical protein ACLQ2Q_19240 [Microbacterium sp. DT81.1]|uniref:hypothetical protein n=1 Tax=Microbacterium sp. DT81.1 TaxID=3393413 RepID=UPI003CE70B1E
MPRTSRTIRAGAAVAGVAGIIAVAGCSAAGTGLTAETDAADTTPSADATPSTDSGSTDSGSTDLGPADTGSSSTYVDGSYSAEGSYQTPESIEAISVTVTLENDVLTAVQVVGDPSARESEEYQSRFIGGIADVVVGEDIDTISVSRVAGSSLTSGGFNQAIEEIKAEAAA